jgi:hypothetical protein
LKRLKHAGVDCEKLERKIAAFRHPEPYQGRFPWDFFPSTAYRIFEFVVKIIASFFVFLLAIFIQVLLFSPYCYDPESGSMFLGLAINNAVLLGVFFISLSIILWIRKLIQSKVAKEIVSSHPISEVLTRK